MFEKGYRLVFAVILTGIFTLPAHGEGVTAEALLGSCATVLAPNANRTKNIEMTLKSLQGRILEPGEVFSFNLAVGRRAASRGYLPAPVLFQDQKSIQIGGGVCQVSSTLYNAALLADLEILERHRHSSPITYLPLGLDATVAYGYMDLKFKNPHAFPVEIRTSLSEDMMTISILGKESLPYEVEVITDVTEIDAPFPDRSSETGKEILRYRLKRKGGLVIEKEYLGKDYYHPVRLDYREGQGRR